MPVSKDEHPKLSDFRNIYVGYDHEEIISMIKSEFGSEDHPKEQFKVPKYSSNKISTSKYNIVNFLPKSIMIQFMRLYNFYFLATVVLQGVPEVSTMPVYLAAVPFCFVIGVSILRELVEEIKRRRQDSQVNNTPAMVLKGDKFHEIKWKDLHVGDIILVHEDESFPADLLLLQCSDHYGTSYIQTMTLDGERALKPRQSYTEILEKMKQQSVGLHQMRMHLR